MHSRHLLQAGRLLPRFSPCQTLESRTFTTSTGKLPSSNRWLRRLGYMAMSGAAIYVWDWKFNASALQRNARTLYTCAIVAADYKLNFRPGQADKIMAIHERVAERLYNLLVDNGGLYIKLGQALAANTALLPAPFQTRFSRLFDDAPQVPYPEIKKVFLSEFGRPPMGENGIFEEFDEYAVASASVAQVHRAKLKKKNINEPDVWLAVKIQKPAVSAQVNWDLAAYRMVMWMYEKWVFDMPVYFLVDFISSHIRLELDFVNEARNAKRTAELIAAEPELAGKVYIPKVYDEFTTQRVMTTEYIDGVKLSDRRAIRRLLKGAFAESPDDNLPDPALLPNWDGSSTPSYSGKPLRGGARAIMESLVSLFSVQIFQWGFVHCDPHPGNIIIRRRIPSNDPQLVLIDHGLYVTMPDELRKDYARLWKGLLSGELSEIKLIAQKWGIGGGGEDLLASGVMLKPWRSGERKGEPQKKVDQYEASQIMKERLRKFLEDTEHFPKALVFLTRNMRMVQGNNQALGSPVNRVKIIGHWASRSLTKAPNLTFSRRLREYFHHLTYITVIFCLDLVFWFSKVRQWLRGGGGLSFEDELELEMRRFSRENLGVELSDNAFVG